MLGRFFLLERGGDPMLKIGYETGYLTDGMNKKMRHKNLGKSKRALKYVS